MQKMSLDTDLTLFKKRKLKLHQRSKYKTQYCKNPEENKKSKLLFVW